jgi:predicted transcriptional regulator
MNQTLTIRLSEDIRLALEDISRKESRPVSGLVREALKNYIAVRRFRKLRRRILPLAEAEGLLMDEDVLREIS